MSSLPTVEAICQTIDDEAACQALLLQALSHGTDYYSFHKKENLTERSEEAASVLVKAWSSTPTLQPYLVDALWLVGSQCHEGNEALSIIVKALVEQVPDREDFWVALQATLDPSLLEAAALLPTKEVLLKKVRKINTKTHYRQQKFNLMQEESEGYAKLLTVILSSPLPMNVSAQMRDLIGTFELDPNRVLDLVLDVLETQMPSDNAKPTQTDAIETILTLLKEFSVDKIPHLLGFKISSSPTVPHTLYATAAFLATEKILDIRAMLPHLPSIDDINKVHTLFEKCARQQIQAMGRIRLNDCGVKGDPKLEAEITKLNEATLTLEKNSLVELVRILLLWNEWELAKLLLSGTCNKVCALLPTSIGQVLCDFVSERIQAVYHANVPAPLNETLENPSPSQIPESASLDEVLDAVLEPLEGIVESACIASHPILYCQLCRLMKALLEKEQSTENLSGTAYLLLKMLVSSLSLFPPNPAISADVWALLTILPYPTRYSLYKEWRGGGLERAGLSSKPLAQVKCETEAGKAARYALKRLSKDKVRDMGRQVSKVTHCNPLVVFSTILSQVESYDNLIDMMVEAVRFVTPLGLDVLGYCILSRLDGTSDTGNRNRMKGKQHCSTHSLSEYVETYLIRLSFICR
jgi:THO complex subunit 2